MSDFTKEELKCLHNAISLQLRDTPMSETNAIKRSELVGKLQSLIDNYCEHDYSESLVRFECGWKRDCNICGEPK
jgi:hypothetical protein